MTWLSWPLPGASFQLPPSPRPTPRPARRLNSPPPGRPPPAGPLEPPTRFGVQVATPVPGAAARPPAVPRGAGAEPGPRWWRPLARRLGAPQAAGLGALVLSAAILQGGAAMIGPAAPIWLVHRLGAPSSFLGVVSLASSLAAMASQRLWARWIEHAGPDRVLGTAGALAACIPLGWLLVWQPWIALPVSAFSASVAWPWGGYSLAMTSRLLQLAPPAERPPTWAPTPRPSAPPAPSARPSPEGSPPPSRWPGSPSCSSSPSPPAGWAGAPSPAPCPAPPDAPRPQP